MIDPSETRVRMVNVLCRTKDHNLCPRTVTRGVCECDCHYTYKTTPYIDSTVKGITVSVSYALYETLGDKNNGGTVIASRVRHIVEKAFSLERVEFTNVDVDVATTAIKALIVRWGKERYWSRKEVYEAFADATVEHGKTIVDPLF